jgi:hypothetical protein
MAISAAALARIDQELERIGLLFEHDRVHPSFTAIAAGEPIAGSWWGHARGHDIYEALHRFHEGSGALSAKLVNGKVTYVHRRLWPELLALARADVARRREGLSPLARSLAVQVEREGLLRAHVLARAGLAGAAELNAAFKELEARLLVYGDSEHTDSGAHARTAESWSHFCERLQYSCVDADSGPARLALEQAARELTRGGKKAAKLGL